MLAETSHVRGQGEAWTVWQVGKSRALCVHDKVPSKPSKVSLTHYHDLLRIDSACITCF